MFHILHKDYAVRPMVIVCKSLNDCNEFLDNLWKTSETLKTHECDRNAIEITPIKNCSLDTGGMILIETPIKEIVVSGFTFRLPITRAASAIVCIEHGIERVPGWIRASIWHRFVIFPKRIKDELLRTLKKMQFDDETLSLSLDEELVLDELAQDNVIIRQVREN